jgi:hypothetical protein
LSDDPIAIGYFSADEIYDLTVKRRFIRFIGLPANPGHGYVMHHLLYIATSHEDCTTWLICFSTTDWKPRPMK